MTSQTEDHVVVKNVNQSDQKRNGDINFSYLNIWNIINYMDVSNADNIFVKNVIQKYYSKNYIGISTT